MISGTSILPEKNDCSRDNANDSTISRERERDRQRER